MCNYYTHIAYIIHMCYIQNINLLLPFKALSVCMCICYVCICICTHDCVCTCTHMHMKDRSQCQVLILRICLPCPFLFVWGRVSHWYPGLANSDGLNGYQRCTCLCLSALQEQVRCVPQHLTGFRGQKWQSKGQSDLRVWLRGIRKAALIFLSTSNTANACTVLPLTLW